MSPSEGLGEVGKNSPSSDTIKSSSSCASIVYSSPQTKRFEEVRFKEAISLTVLKPLKVHPNDARTASGLLSGSGENLLSR